MQHLKKVNAASVSSIRSPEAIAYGSDIGHPAQSDAADRENISVSVLSNEIMPELSNLSLPAAAIRSYCKESCRDRS